MAQPDHRSAASLWQSIRELPGRTPLRVKLITAVLTLVAVALAVISVSGLSFLRSYLLGQADNQLNTVASAVLSENNLRPRQAAGIAPEPWTASVVSGGSVIPVYLPTVPGPEISPTASWLHNGSSPVTVSAQSGPDRWRVVAIPDVPLTNGTTGILVVGIDVASEYAALARLTTIDVVVSIVILAGLAAVSTTVVRASLRPLTDIEQTAGAIAAGDLSQRVPESDARTEMGRLGRSLNAMLSQIEAAFVARSRSEAAARRSEEKMRQFIADASHELRTPLTAIRGFAEYYRQRGGVQVPGNGATGHLTRADLDRIMRRVEQESARMGVLVEDLLLLARLDQQRPLESKPVDLLTLAADAVHDARVVAPSRHIQLTVGSPAALLIMGDEVRLRQVIGNLMTNALTHTPDGTPIEVLIRAGSLDEAPASPPLPWKPAAVLEVADHGPGLSREQAEHVFERFYRADTARTAGGTGLGLAIVASLVAAHGGAVWVESAPGQGATFCIALPLTPEAAESSADNDDIDAGAIL